MLHIAVVRALLQRRELQPAARVDNGDRQVVIAVRVHAGQRELDRRRLCLVPSLEQGTPRLRRALAASIGAYASN
jgi:hypothetical protein